MFLLFVLFVFRKFEPELLDRAIFTNFVQGLTKLQVFDYRPRVPPSTPRR